VSIEFAKYHGLEMTILIDNRSSSKPVITPEQAVKLCDRHFGIGADGVILALPGQDEPTIACGFSTPMALSQCVAMEFAV